MFQVFNCTKGEDGKFRIASSPSNECFTGNWNIFVSFDAILIAFYVVVLPILTFRIVKSAKSKNDTLVIDSLVRPLCQNYKPANEWFELVKLGFKLCLAL
jgi:hypothetical protein